MDPARRPSPVDALLAGFLALVVLAEAFTEPAVQEPALHALVGTTVMLAIAWRRAFPLLITVIVVAGNMVLGANGGELSVVFGLLVMAFTVGSETEGRRSWAGLLELLSFFLVMIGVGNRALVPGDLGAGVVLIALPWVAGRTLRERASSLAAAMSRADRLEEEKLHEAEAAAAKERTRLARELHDVVSHSISMIAIQTQAVRRRLGRDHPADAADLAAVEAAARESMAEMRRLFGVLREDGEQAALAPQPGLGELGRLLDRVRETGVEVELVTEGDVVELSPGLDLAAYRIVQEAVTNVLRHSGARHLSVRLGYAAGELRVTVEDDGRGIGSGTPRDGHGLRGIRERAELYGGTLEVGQRPSGGARVHARLPVGSHP
jgi:signal transduction histidine kinase